MFLNLWNKKSISSMMTHDRSKGKDWIFVDPMSYRPKAITTIDPEFGTISESSISVYQVPTHMMHDKHIFVFDYICFLDKPSYVIEDDDIKLYITKNANLILQAEVKSKLLEIDPQGMIEKIETLIKSHPKRPVLKYSLHYELISSIILDNI
jgi:hypothetical protein